MGLLSRVGIFIFRCFGWLGAFPWIFSARTLRFFVGKKNAFAFSAQGVAAVPGLLGNFIRSAFYHSEINSPLDLDMHFGSLVTQPQTKIGNRVWIGLYSTIGASEIGCDVLVGSRVSIVSGKNQHGTENPNKPYSSQVGEYKTITIGAGAWLGEGSIIMDNVGAKTVVGAGAVVTRDLGPCVVVVGNPAKTVKEL